jgi:hypothetical protein
MSNFEALVEEVELALAIWCYEREQTSLYACGCNCPKFELIEGAAPEALEALLNALNTGAYSGDWERYLGPQN